MTFSFKTLNTLIQTVDELKQIFKELEKHNKKGFSHNVSDFLKLFDENFLYKQKAGSGCSFGSRSMQFFYTLQTIVNIDATIT